MAGDDLPRDRGFRAPVADHRELDLPFPDRPLEDGLRVEREGLVERPSVTARYPDAGNTHGRSHDRRLDEDGRAERLDDRAPGRSCPAFGHCQEGGDGNSGVAEEALCNILVHADRRAEDSRSHEWKVREPEQPLDGTVLAEETVKHGEHGVERGE